MWIKSRIFLFCALAVASFGYAAQDDAKPPAWQVEGLWTALNDENPKVMAAAIQNTEARDELLVALGVCRTNEVKLCI